MSAAHPEFIADEFLANEPDCPVFGLNLACAYPFPTAAEPSYTAMSERLAKLDEAVYVYPFWETHVTLMTFLNFTLNRRPSAERLQELHALIGPLVKVIQYIFDKERIQPFQLEFRAPALTPKAAILPASNSTGEIARIRQQVCRRLEEDKALHEQFMRRGFNVPGIIHSTIMRFKNAPRDLPGFIAGFDAVAASTPSFAVMVEEILLTTETKPYMRGGEILQRFKTHA